MSKIASPPKNRVLSWNDSTSSQQVIDMLGEKTSLYNYDIVADEMAEIVSKHTFGLRVDDNENSALASFKPVNLPS